MKRFIIMFTMCFVISFRGFTDDSFNSIGVTIGGTALISFEFEHHFGNNSLRVRTGTSVGEINLATTFNHYFSASSTKPFLGLGIWNTIVPYKGIEHIHLVNIPVGVNWHTSNRKDFGIEVDLNYFITGRHHDGEKVTFNQTRFIPLPAFYYKYRLSE